MKNKKTKVKIFLSFLVVIGIGTGCHNNQNQLDENHKDLNISQVHTNKPIDQSIANNAKEKIIIKEEISDVKAVNTDKELFTAIKVDNFNRFRLKKIEKEVKSVIEKMYPNLKVIVSSDKKMFWELEKLEQKLQKDNANMKDLKKDFNNIKKLMKEQT
ncbi:MULTISPECIES: YhcN/YlaJ family sporulation lipoprotein [unclassified Mesobacillus]|uniref:YhcN/YlaJ family sporulation lipoprotein n=1 Tax=unclassified Mesobacillus TaxID=2675270 RepID=UPI00203ECAEB|nr:MULTISPECIES: YhcN/YlaJ family sporulation lipoprotein [unclassified Mesobacillus]MCM3126085.1 YhcN/YlaJ family sporulation lipoprotein [Mesobacillus sp. MER 33]MCM3234543.1 YhcN/YlaJ family sporulation lipoprotein [Mesobacillus sp. MER 48]